MCMEKCLFCDIVEWKKFGAKVYEDSEVIAILDKFPNVEWMTLVLPKKHYDSYVFDMPEKEYIKYMVSTQRVAKLLEEALNVKRVAMVMEGMWVNHAHMKLYPLYWLEEKFIPMSPQERVFFEKYAWYVTTIMGEEKSDDYLEKLAISIRS